MNSDFPIEPFQSHHDRAAFCCGVEQFNRYFRQQISQDVKRYFATAFVLIDRNSATVAGYYTLSYTSILIGELPSEIVKKIPKYERAPAVLLGRLAVDKNYQGKGLGEILLFDALFRCKESTSKTAAMAVVVDAKDDRARSFYERYQFICFPNKPNKLFLTMTAIAKMLTE